VCFLENYPGFPGGIDVGTFQDLLADHVETAGCDRIEETVDSVRRRRRTPASSSRRRPVGP
jgi:thioredoxin reductase